MRERLTELGVDFVARQVPRDEEDRDELRAETGESEIPVLVADGLVVAGDDAILETLERRFASS